MARNREFETEPALEKAMCLFWAGGYNGISTQELIDRLGISKSSLYGAFGDKKALFVRTLERYRDAASRAIIDKLDRSTGIRATIREILQEVVRSAFGDRGQKGCYIVNSTVEQGSHDKEIGKIVRQYRLAVEKAFVRAIRRGISSGEIAAGKDAGSIARLICTTINGIYVDSRVLPDGGPYEEMIGVLLALL